MSQSRPDVVVVGALHVPRQQRTRLQRAVSGRSAIGFLLARHKRSISRAWVCGLARRAPVGHQPHFSFDVCLARSPTHIVEELRSVNRSDRLCLGGQKLVMD